MQPQRLILLFGNLQPTLALSATSIAEASANNTTLGTASIVGSFSGTASWSITDATGTFQINSSTGVVTVLDNTDLVNATHPTIPVTISVSGVTPAPANLAVSIAVTTVVAGRAGAFYQLLFAA
jgi:hypothetical protein